MPRKEFDKKTKREALRRSGGKCEAEGPLYGLEQGQVCGANLGAGFDIDHRIADSHGGSNTLDNALCVCRTCHAFKTKNDVKIAAKLKRQSDKHRGIRNTPRNPIPGSKASGWKRKMNGELVRR